MQIGQEPQERPSHSVRDHQSVIATAVSCKQGMHANMGGVSYNCTKQKKKFGSPHILANYYRVHIPVNAVTLSCSQLCEPHYITCGGKHEWFPYSNVWENMLPYLRNESVTERTNFLNCPFCMPYVCKNYYQPRPQSIFFWGGSNS